MRAMLSRLFSWRTRLRRLFSRVYWLRPLLARHLPVIEGDHDGLILIQIDGLSLRQFERALDSGRMPFLHRLLRRENYAFRPHYSGLPSTTPAVQGELFYGVRTAVPAYGFRDPHSGRMVTMLEQAPAAAVECRLAQHPGLLAGGSGYCNVYSGGASESHFCAANTGWNPPDGLSAFRLAVVAALNLFVLVRMFTLTLIELGIAMYDLVVGSQEGHPFWRELKFIPVRVAISVLLREVATLGARIDAARGLPVIHVNFLGYDEQSHRRGPDSAFAHWTLGGIDDAIKRIWNEARRSSLRDYDLWVFSDHGQQRVEPYERRCGRTVERAVAGVMDAWAQPHTPSPARSVMLQRIDWMGWTGLSSWLARVWPDVPSPYNWIAADGPVAHVYPPQPVPPEEVPAVARRLVEEAAIPMVAVAGPHRSARVWTARGERRLPDDAAELLGADHPFLNEAACDLVDVIGHKDAGQFVLLGWDPAARPVSFAPENGAHGGPGPEETGGFLLAPLSDRLPGPENSLRPLAMRLAAMRVLHRVGEHPHAERRGRVASGRTVRVMTYNIHSCRGLDGRYSIQRVARAVAEHHVDVLCLQEVDIAHGRSGFHDQAQRLAEALEMGFCFLPLLQRDTQHYGIATLSHLPLRQVKADFLPGLRWMEPRGALWAEVLIGDVPVQVLNTHLGLNPRERQVQVDTLLGPEWLGSESCRPPVVLCGDFNLGTGTGPFQRLKGPLRDVEDAGVSVRRRARTFPSEYPFLRLDHILVSPEIRVLAVTVPHTQVARIASDHLPLVAHVELGDGHISSG